MRVPVLNGIDCHANLNSVIDIKFLNCSFSVKSNIENIAGIRTHNSSFLVDGIMHPTSRKYQRSVFENMKHGIYATASLSNRNFSVKNSVFRKCYKGIFASGVQNLSATNNFFTQRLLISNPTYKLIGIALEYCSGYTIQHDTIICNIENNDRSEVGMYIKNSGPNENLIYNNVIIHMNEAIICEGENRNNDLQGLCIKCNQFLYNRNDVRIIPGEDIWIFNQGIKKYQGSSENQVTSPAGNTFSNPAVLFNIDNELCRPIEYFHHRLSPPLLLRPPDNKVRIINKTVTLTLNNFNHFYRPDACPPKTISPDTREELIAGTLLADSEIIDTKIELDNLIDDGDTPLMVSNIYTSAPFEALWLRDELLNASPYLSDSALTKAAEKEDVLNSALIRDVMVANPQSAKANVVIEALEQRSEPLPEIIWTEINAGKNQISAKQALEIRISDLSAEKAENRLLLLHTYQAENKYDSVRWLLEQIPERLSAYQYAWTWFDEGNAGYGLSELQNIDLASIPECHRNYHNGYEQIAGIIYQLANDTAYFLKNDTISLNNLYNLALNDNTAGIAARNLLTAYRLLDYEATIPIFDTTLKSATVSFHSDKATREERISLKVFPNPATDFTIIDYRIENSGELELVSLDGRVLKSEFLKHGNNQILLRTNSLPAGIYTIRLSGDKKIHVSKFVIK